jgi:Uncharacterized protein conserved in bacteria (DUF2199)
MSWITLWRSFNTLPMDYAFSAPRNWFGVPEAERATRAKLSADLCTIDCPGWSQAPPSVVILGDILIVIANIVFYFVFRENTYGAATIQRGFSRGTCRVMRTT